MNDNVTTFLYILIFLVSGILLKLAYVVQRVLILLLISLGTLLLVIVICSICMLFYFLPSENIKDFCGRFVDVVLDTAGLIMDWCIEENKKAKLFAWGRQTVTIYQVTRKPHE